SPNGKYNLRSGFILNTDTIPESGGLINNDVLSKPSEVQPNFEEVYLITARNEVDNTQIFINQSYSFNTNNTPIASDTQPKENTSTTTATKPIKKSLYIPKINYNFSYKTNKYSYIDRNNIPKVNHNFYKNYFINQRFTEDAIQT